MVDGNGGGRQKILLVAALVLLAGAGIYGYRAMISSSPDYSVSYDRMYKCNECGYVFEHTLKEGDMEPFECPDCGKMAGYLAEKCYWTKGPDGEWKAKLEPTFVILKKRMDHQTTEKTYCPDCGREVVGHNPMPPQELMDQARAEAGQ